MKNCQISERNLPLKMTVFWDVAPCSMVEIDRRFGGAYCLHLYALMKLTDVSEVLTASIIIALMM
jgi:hypothetical protein